MARIFARNTADSSMLDNILLFIIFNYNC